MTEEISAALDSRVRGRPEGRFGRFARNPLTIVENRLYRRLGLSRRVSLPTFWGGRFDGVLPESVTTMVKRQGYTDQRVCLALLHSLSPGATFVDVGAHFGFFTLLASKLVGPEGRVLSVEAMPGTFEQLQRNISRNASHANVQAVECAAGDRPGSLEFHDYGLVFSSLNSAFASRGDEHTHEVRKVQAQMKPLDQICADLKRIDLIKIDAESSEHLVIAGMNEIIARHAPAICVEVSDGTPAERLHSERVIGLLAEKGYTAHRFVDGDLVPAQGPIGYDNFLFLQGQAPG